MEALHNGNQSECHGFTKSNGEVQQPANGDGKNDSKSVVPPYWSHRRYESYASVENTKPPPITLEDHTEGFSEQSDSVWAKGVVIEDYVLVQGNVPNIGNFIVWNCRIDMLDVSLILNTTFYIAQALITSYIIILLDSRVDP